MRQSEFSKHQVGGFIHGIAGAMTINEIRRFKASSGRLNVVPDRCLFVCHLLLSFSCALAESGIFRVLVLVHRGEAS